MTSKGRVCIVYMVKVDVYIEKGGLLVGLRMVQPIGEVLILY